MKENVLKKEFKEKDVNRLRNIIQGKFGEKSSTSVGYTKIQEFHKEGDIWFESGKKWTIKNNIKQNITKLDNAKKTMHLPLFCPECKAFMKHKFDKPFYLQYDRCWSCQISFETELRRLGIWEEYQNNIFNTDIDCVIEDFKIWSDEAMNETMNSYITEAGDVENWVDKSKNKNKSNREETIKYLLSLKK